MKKLKPKIAGIGELLWDMHPDGGRLGGAPANFACHCHQLGGESYPVSCLGQDQLGRLARTELEHRGVSTRFLQESSTHATGRVQVELDAAAKPSYEILENVAWDHLQLAPELQALVSTLDAACFGILAQRSSASRETIQTLLRQMPETSTRILDVNLRSPFFSKELIEQSLGFATVLKLSDEELPVLTGYFALEGDVTQQLAALRERFALDLIAYTRGPEGSMLIGASEIHETPGIEITPVDSVGAGDSFTAALCIGLLKGFSLAEVNIFANRVAAFVCSRKGACPEIPVELMSP